MKKITYLVNIAMCVLSCNACSKAGASLISYSSETLPPISNQSSINNPSAQSQTAPLDGYIIPYNNSFSTLTALNDEVIKFKQEDTEKHHFYSLDNTKISDLYEINYIVDGFYHTEKRILFSLQTLKTVVSIKDGEQVKNITITTNGTNKDSLEGLSVNRSDPYSLMIGDEKIGDINTSLELDYVNQLISSASTLLSIPSE